jgi:hypothetical protein
MRRAESAADAWPAQAGRTCVVNTHVRILRGKFVQIYIKTFSSSEQVRHETGYCFSNSNRALYTTHCPDKFGTTYILYIYVPRTQKAPNNVHQIIFRWSPLALYVEHIGTSKQGCFLLGQYGPFYCDRGIGQRIFWYRWVLLHEPFSHTSLLRNGLRQNRITSHFSDCHLSRGRESVVHGKRVLALWRLFAAL